MDGIYEQVVKKHRNLKDNIKAIAYILFSLLVPVVCVLLAVNKIVSAYFVYIGFFLLIALVPLALWLINLQKTEFEYQVIDNTLFLDKILAKRKRKKIVKIRIDEIKSIVNFSDANYKGKKINKYFIGVDDINDKNALAFVFYNEARGNCAAVLTPDKNILTGMRPKLAPELQVQVLKMIREK